MLMKTEKLLQAFPLGMAGEGARVRIVGIMAGKNLVKRLLAMGMSEDTEVRVLQRQKGNGMVVACGETRLALGMGMAHKIMVVPV